MNARDLDLRRKLPLVSCILPTADRVGHALQALRCFDRQDYARRELVVVDDGADASLGEALAGRGEVRYLRPSARLTIGAKRNLACEAARGEIVVHFDDDDWSGPTRISRLVDLLLASGAELAGQQELYFYRPADRAAWLFVATAARRADWLAGASLAYRKSLWRRHAFPERNNGEDWAFVRAAAAEAPLAVLADPSVLVATIHAGNTCVKDVLAPMYRPRPAAEVEALLGDDLPTYLASGAASAAVGEAA